LERLRRDFGVSFCAGTGLNIIHAGVPRVQLAVKCATTKESSKKEYEAKLIEIQEQLAAL